MIDKDRKEEQADLESRDNPHSDDSRNGEEQ